MDLEDMEVDLDFETDPIKDFLQTKLEEIRHRNEKLEKVIADKKEMLQNFIVMSSTIQSKSLQLVEIWKMVHNDKCVFGFHLKNLEENQTLIIRNIVLNWNSSDFITYRFKSFKLMKSIKTDALQKIYPKESNEILEEGILVVAIDKPSFSNRIEYNLNGIILHTMGGNSSEDGEQQLIVSDFEILAKDFMDSNLEVKNDELLDFDVKGLTTILTASETFILCGKVEDQNIEVALRSDCKYKEINVEGENRLFFIHDISQNIDGSLIEVSNEEHKIFRLKIMCVKEETALLIIHHIYTCVPDIIILPKADELCLHQPKSSHDLTEYDQANRIKFSEALSKQIKFIEEFYSRNGSECDGEAYRKFRLELNQLQYDTDVLYIKCSNNI